MARKYIVAIDQASVLMGTACDLVQILGPTGSRIIRILEVSFFPTGGTTLASSATFLTRCQFFPATVTRSGGTSVTPRPVDPGDSAASFTAWTNNTTQMTTTPGPAVDVTPLPGGQVYGGLTYGLGAPVILGPNEGFAFQLIAGLAQTLVCGGGVVVEEIGG